MAAFQGGDADAFREIVVRHMPGVFNFMARHTSPRMADDLAQEVFLRVVERKALFKHESRLSTWLYAIARNLGVDTLRKLAHRKHASLDEPGATGAPLVEELSDDHPGGRGDVTAERAESGERIQGALAVLPEEQREVFLLREVGELPFPEIALITGASENTVKSRMRYAIVKLRELLRPAEGGSDP